MKLAKEIAAALYDGTFHGDTPSSGDRECELAYLEPIIAAKLEEFHRTMKVRLESVEYALDPTPKWTNNTSPQMTQHGALMMVRCVLAMFEEE